MSEQRILIPEKIYVGVGSGTRSVVDSPPASITAWGTDSAAQSRINTVNKYSKRNLTLANTPMTGFSLSANNYKEEWWVIDPRGFATLVKFAHIAALMLDCTVVNGTIINPCVWARESGSNILLAAHTDQYRRAVLSTRFANSNIPWKTAQLGDQIVISNGLSGQYLGKYYNVCVNLRPYSVQSPKQKQLSVSNNTTTVIVEQVSRNHWRPNVTQLMHYLGSPKLAQTQTQTVLTESQAELLINQNLISSASDVLTTQSGSIVVSTRHKISDSDIQLSLADHAQHSFDQAVAGVTRNADGANVVAVLQSGVHVLATGSVNKVGDYTGQVIDTTELANHQLVFKSTPDRHGRGVVVEHARFSLADVVSYHSLMISVKTKLGNTITRAL